MRENTEKLAFDLARVFLSFYRKHTYKTFRLSTVKKSKWWPYFIKVINEYSNRPDWDAYIWVACQFEKFGKIFPTQLVGSRAEEAFEEYSSRFKENTIKQLANNLVITYNEILKWSKKNNFSKVNFEALFEDKKMTFRIERGEIIPDIFSVVRAYHILPEERRRRIMSLEKLQIKRALIMNNKKIKNKMKELLGEEFI